MTTIKKSAHPRDLPPMHPGLAQRVREAEQAEVRGETPRQIDQAQKVTRPSLEATTLDRAQQARAIGLVDPAYKRSMDGLAAIAEQEPFRPGTSLDAIWDTLPESDKIRAGATERFRLEMDASLRLAAMAFTRPHLIGGRLDARNLKRSIANVEAEISAFDYLLAPDSRELLTRFVRQTGELVVLCLREKAVQGIDAPVMHDLLRDLAQKLIYQELVSRRRAMGDRGIRRILGNVELAELVYAQLKRIPKFSPRDRLLMRVIHVHQDLGHTAYAARVSFRGTRLHRNYGARIFTDEINRYRTLFSQDEIEIARAAVATHSSEDLPFASARVLALIRAIDHLAPFAPYRVFKHLEGISGARDYLVDLLARVQKADLPSFTAAKEAFRTFLSDQELPPPLRDDLWAAFRPFERQADLVDLGSFAGAVGALKFQVGSPGELLVQLDADDFARQYQALFDVQQEQLLRFARGSGLTPDDVRQAQSLRLGLATSGKVVITRV